MLTIIRKRLDELHLDPANARVHPQKNMDSIIGSLRQFGQVDPIVVQKATGKIIGGNGRYQAMRTLGWKECDVVEADLDDLHATALGIALNRTGELAEWDNGTLRTLLGTLRDDNFALEGIGFDDEDLAKILDDIEKIGGGSGAEEQPITSQFMVLVSCQDEAEQIDLLRRFSAEGLHCKALLS